MLRKDKGSVFKLELVYSLGSDLNFGIVLSN